MIDMRHHSRVDRRHSRPGDGAINGAADSPSPMNAIAEGYVKLVLASASTTRTTSMPITARREWKTEAERQKRPLRGDRRRGRTAAFATLGRDRQATRRAGRAASRVPRQAASGPASARAHADGREAVVRRGVRGALRRRRADASRVVLSGRARRARRRLPRQRPARRALRRVSRRRSSFRQDGSTPSSTRRSPRCRARTLQHVTLPAGESFTVEYVTNKSWSGYNWYQGNYRSLIQVNTDLPIYIDRAIDLACHEGYPGHHVYNALLEKHLVRDRGWVEFTVYPLFSPQSLIAEGTANYGIEVAFPGRGTRRRSSATCCFRPPAWTRRRRRSTTRCRRSSISLSYAGNEAARRYLNGEIDRAAAADWLERYALMSPPRAEQRDAVHRPVPQLRDQLQPRQGSGERVHRSARRRRVQPARRWDVFLDLLRSPRLPSGLR